jgi:quercetin dioxygenase-like cupin family protein
MAKILDNGSVRLEIVTGAADSQGAFLEMAATYRAGSQAPPVHYHPEQEETFTIKKGALNFNVDGKWRVVEAGSQMVIPVAANHTVKNARSDEEAVVTWIVRPALRTEELFTILYNFRKRPNLLSMAVILREYRNEFVLTKPPRVVQSCVFGLLAPIGRALGYGLSQ